MEAIILFISMLIVHWLADYVFQTHEMAMNKSSSNRWLVTHTLVYSGIWSVAIFIYIIYAPKVEFPMWRFTGFVLITFVAHTVTDYITSREVKKYFDKDDYHNGFVVIGIDQVLHYVQLLLTFYFIYL